MPVQRELRIAALSIMAICASGTAWAQKTTVVIDGRSYEIDDDRPLVTMPDGTPGYADGSVSEQSRSIGNSEADSVSIAMSSVAGMPAADEIRPAPSVGARHANARTSPTPGSSSPTIRMDDGGGTAPRPVIGRTWPAGLTIPPRAPDGSYATPNKGLSRAATVWHMRVALNVAALGCRGYGSDRLVSGYNTMLSRHRRELAYAQSSLAREYGVGRGRSRKAYDDSMTRLYNFWATPSAQEGFCRAAIETIEALESNDVSGGDLGTFCGTRLGRLEQPFIAFFQEYDAWRSGAGEIDRASRSVTMGAPVTGPTQTTSAAFVPVGRRR